MTIHLRQYVIGPEARLVNADWKSRQLPSGLVLSHDPRLPAQQTELGLVLGDAVATEGDGAPATWTGRWLLLGDDRLQLDACGLLACYRRRVGDRLWLSSSPEILRGLEPPLPMHEDRLERNRAVMDWYPPPHSAIAGIDRLLPSQSLSLPDGALSQVRLPGPDPSLDFDTIVRRSEARLTRAMSAADELASQQDGRVWIGLTAGRDSRTLLAAAIGAGVEVMTYTFIRAKTSAWDRQLPPQLAEALGVEHVQIPLEGIDPERVAAFEEHTAASYMGGPWLQHATGAWETMEAGAIALEGGCLEFARSTYFLRLPRDMGPTAADTTRVILERFPSPRPEGVRAWVDWMRGKGRQDDIDWRDRFYVEQRCGGWMSAGLQGFDLSGRRQLHLANCAALLSDLYSVPEQDRFAGAPQAEVVRRLAPALAAFPYNPGSTKHSGRSRAAASAAGQRESTGLRARLGRIGRRG